MNNRINQVVTLADGTKYFILKQAIYNDENYFVVSRVSDDGEKLEDEFALMHEILNDQGAYVELVKDPNVLQLLIKYLKLA